MNQFQVTVYNPLARYVEYNIRVPISGTSYTVVGPSGITVPSEVSCSQHASFEVTVCLGLRPIVSSECVHGVLCCVVLCCTCCV